MAATATTFFKLPNQVFGKRQPQGAMMPGGLAQSGAMAPSQPAQAVQPDYTPIPFGTGDVDSPNANSARWNPYKLAQDFFPWARQQVGFASSLEPGREAAIRQFIQQMSPEARRALAKRYQEMMKAQAMETGRANASTLAGQGYGQTAQTGAAIDARNRGNVAASDYATQMDSPEAMLQALQGVLGAYGQGQTISSLPDLINISQLGFEPYGLPGLNQPDKGGLGGLFGTVLGSAAGGLDWNKIFGIGGK